MSYSYIEGPFIMYVRFEKNPRAASILGDFSLTIPSSLGSNLRTSSDFSLELSSPIPIFSRPRLKSEAYTIKNGTPLKAAPETTAIVR